MGTSEWGQTKMAGGIYCFEFGDAEKDLVIYKEAAYLLTKEAGDEA